MCVENATSRSRRLWRANLAAQRGWSGGGKVSAHFDKLCGAATPLYRTMTHLSVSSEIEKGLAKRRKDVAAAEAKERCTAVASSLPPTSLDQLDSSANIHTRCVLYQCGD